MTMGGRVDMKVVILGMGACGKTSLVDKYLYDRFSENVPYQTVIIRIIVLPSHGMDIHLALWRMHKNNTIFKSHQIVRI